MARRPVPGEGTPEPRRSAAAASTPRSRRTRPVRRGRERSLLERYSGLLTVALLGAGLLAILFFLIQGTARAGYQCDALLTPGPTESLTPRPSPLGTPSPSPASPSPIGTAPASPAGSPTPGQTGVPTPATSPGSGASPSPGSSPSPAAAPSPAPEPTARLGFTVTDLGALHVNANQQVSYPFCPPASGRHFNERGIGPIPARVYPPAQEQSPGGWVHNLEHGYVVALYRCPSPEECPSDAEMAELERFFEEAPASEVNPQCQSKIVVARFDGMATRFALLAWDRVLLTDEFDLDTALTFTEQWLDHEAVPERGACP